jgi:uncharacterized protein
MAKVSNNDDTVLRRYAASAAADAAAWRACFTSDGSFTEPASLPYGGTYRGHRELETIQRTLVDYWEELRVDMESLHDAGSTVVVVARARGRARRTGGTIDERLVDVLTLEDGLIKSSIVSIDTSRVLDALGVEPKGSLSSPVRE